MKKQTFDKLRTDFNNNFDQKLKPDEILINSFNNLSIKSNNNRKLHWNSSIYSNDIFEILFDILTPRPHFIIKFRNHKTHLTQTNKWVYINNLVDNELNSLFTLVKDFRLKFKLDSQDTILSFHTGSWANTNEFHAHICVSEKEYLRVLDEYENLINLENFRPTRQYKLKRNNGETMFNYYKNNVINYINICKQSGNLYKSKEIDLIKSKNLARKQIVNKSNDEFNLEFDSFEPTLKLKSKKSEIDFKKILNEMINIGYELDIFTKVRGAHLCLHMEMNNNIHGSINLSFDHYYSIHPQPDVFLNNIQITTNQDYFKTT